jgi:hypothetical protein
VINRPRDLEIARLLGWYRIPLRTAPKVVAVDHLAFYQTSSFGENRWQIRFTAPVLGHELTTRGELLRDETGHPRAGEEYYKIQIGPLECLEEPIQAEKWRRLTFLYTTGEYLLGAHSLNDLVIKNEERQQLWQALRERASREQEYRVNEIPALNLEPEILACLLGISSE